jgi:hypothetical protein
MTAEQRFAFERDGPVRASGWPGLLTPVQRQLLGGAEDPGGDHAWGRDPAATRCTAG